MVNNQLAQQSEDSTMVCVEVTWVSGWLALGIALGCALVADICNSGPGLYEVSDNDGVIGLFKATELLGRDQISTIATYTLFTLTDFLGKLPTNTTFHFISQGSSDCGDITYSSTLIGTAASVLSAGIAQLGETSHDYHEMHRTNFGLLGGVFAIISLSMFSLSLCFALSPGRSSQDNAASDSDPYTAMPAV